MARAVALDCDAFQIFVKSPNRWSALPRTEDAARTFRELRDIAELPVVAHAGYLINLASPKPEVVQKSRAALLDELRRCDALGVPGLVLHPGAPQDDGREVGIERVASGLDAVLDELGHDRVKVLLENTAGQGSTLGVSIDELQAIRALAEHGGELGICLDTCHAFAAGYDLTDADGYERLVSELTDGPGTSVLACWHLNDSKFPLGRRKDRHANIGDGEIGLEPFARLLNDERFADVPMILETPLGDDEQGHARDLATLRSLIGPA